LVYSAGVDDASVMALELEGLGQCALVVDAPGPDRAVNARRVDKFPLRYYRHCAALVRGESPDNPHLRVVPDTEVRSFAGDNLSPERHPAESHRRLVKPDRLRHRLASIRPQNLEAVIPAGEQRRSIVGELQ